MQEWPSENKKIEAHNTLEGRLSAYYGPVLPEQPLSSSSWLHLSSQLGPHRTGKRWLRPRWRMTPRRASQTLPFSVQEALARIAFQADMLSTAQKVQCTYKPRIRVPSVHISLLRKQAIRLTLPTQIERSPSQAELDVLLASGLARYTYICKPAYAVIQLLLSTLLLLLLLTTILIAIYGHITFPPVMLLLIACLCILCSAVFWLLNRQARQMVRRADTLMVQWIGREQTCRGLHALAARSGAPSRRTWGGLSLSERIHNICHTPVSLEEERFTLVR